MAYTPTNWTNFPSTATPVNASNLNKIEAELVALDTGKADESTVTTALEGKVDKVEGKGLSENDFTDTLKDKLDGISEQANNVEITPVVTEGTTLATISIDGVDTDIKGSDIDVDSAMSPTSENPVQNKVITATLEDKADKDGNYEDMAVGQLLSNIYEEDKVPYNFRTAGGTLEIGDREYDTLVGGSVVWNQLCNMDYSETGISASRTKLIIASTISAGSRNKKVQDLNIPTNHVVLLTMHKKSGTMTGTVQIGMLHTTGTTSWQGTIPLSSANGTTSIIYKSTDTIEALQLFLYSGFTISADFEADFNVTDLTAMFNSTIAGYVNTLETSQAGSGIAWLKKYGYFTKDYYAYSANTMKSVNVSAHNTVGFNQWDEEWEVGGISDITGLNNGATNLIRSKNYIPVVPSTQYFYHSETQAYAAIYKYDSGYNFIGKIDLTYDRAFTTNSNCQYIRFVPNANYGTTYKNDICINFHWDGSRDGEYEAYSEHIYPLDSDLELRGIPKLDSNNKLYYDGDTYESDGTVTRKYAEIDLGSLNWTSAGTDTSGLYRYESNGIADTVKLATRNLMSEYSICINNNHTDGVKELIVHPVNKNIVAWSDSSTTTAFKTAMNNIHLQYELATPTTETADTFQNPQLVSNWGTEEYTDSREVQIPVGHITKYPPDLKAKLESAPDSPASDGDYILRHSNGVNTYVADTKELPTVPTTDGTYVLKATVSSGTATLSWVAE